MQKEGHFWEFFEPFLPQQLLSFYSFSSAPSYYYSDAVLYFTPQCVYWQQCAMSQAAQESTIYWLPSLQWALKDVPVDLIKFLGGLWDGLSGSWSSGVPEVQAKEPNWTWPKLMALCACLILLIYVCSAQIVSALRKNSDFNPEHYPRAIRLVAYLYKFSGSPCNQSHPGALMMLSTFWFCKWFSPGPPAGNGFRKPGLG